MKYEILFQFGQAIALSSCNNCHSEDKNKRHYRSKDFREILQNEPQIKYKP